MCPLQLSWNASRLSCWLLCTSKSYVSSRGSPSWYRNILRRWYTLLIGKIIRLDETRKHMNISLSVSVFIPLYVFFLQCLGSEVLHKCWGILDELKNITRWFEESRLFSAHVAEQQEIMEDQSVENHIWHLFPWYIPIPTFRFSLKCSFQELDFILHDSTKLKKNTFCFCWLKYF